MRKPFLLLETVIAMLLIATITSFAAVNVRKVMEKARSFQTERTLERIEEALNYAYISGEGSAEQIEQNCVFFLEKSPFIKDGKRLLRDGWGRPIKIRFNRQTGLFEAKVATTNK